MKNIIIFLAFMILSLNVYSQNSGLNIITQNKKNIEYSIYINDGNNNDLLIESKKADRFNGQFNEGVYKFTGKYGSEKNIRQISKYFYLKKNENFTFKFDFNVSPYKIEFLSKDNVNKVLFQLEEFINSESLKIWNKGVNKKEGKEYFEYFINKLDKITYKYKLPNKIVEFIKVWNYINIKQIKEALSSNKIEISKEQIEDIYNNINILDNDLTLRFYNGTYYIYQSLLGKTLKEKTYMLKEKFHNKKIICEVLDKIFKNYINKYNYKVNFKEGLVELEDACKYADIDGSSYINSFKSKKYTLEGSLLPDIQLENTDGKTMSLKDLSIKGKILYIDCWASWCHPCCAEIPYLLKIEKEFKNENIVFVSISLDKEKNAWIKKMEDLGISKENQYRCLDKGFFEKLGVSGIPHFFIYDKDGKLTFYNAPRPSSANALEVAFKQAGGIK